MSSLDRFSGISGERHLHLVSVLCVQEEFLPRCISARWLTQLAWSGRWKSVGGGVRVAFTTLICSGEQWTLRTNPTLPTYTVDRLSDLCASVLLVCRVVFLGLITCLSGSSYFFLIAVIILLKRQFRKTELETELQQTKASKGIELKVPSSIVGEERGACSGCPGLLPGTKVCVSTVTGSEEAVRPDGLSSTNMAPESQRLTGTTAKVTPQSSDEINS